jgi:endonuclease-3
MARAKNSGAESSGVMPGLFVFEKEPREKDTRLEDLDQRLRAMYGAVSPREVWDPLTQLIYSLLSARTKTPESHAVLRALRDRYDGWPREDGSVCWDRLLLAPLAEIEETAAAATFIDRKAPQLKETLEEIKRRTGRLSLNFLAAYKTEKIRAWLEQFPGVGVKTSGAVVNFSWLRRRAICIDSHHQRIAIRLGLAPKGADPREVESRLMAMAPAEWSAEQMDEHHSLVKLHGQRLCVAKEPLCGRCALRVVCPTGGGEERLGLEEGRAISGGLSVQG